MTKLNLIKMSNFSEKAIKKKTNKQTKTRKTY